MSYPSIFDHFKRVECISDGASVFDFLGGAIDASFKHNWSKNVVPSGRKFTPAYPSLSEWTVDWIACLAAARTAGNDFKVIELGAGYGQWMVTAIMAYKALKPMNAAYGLALEADPTHFGWLEHHVKGNLDGFEKTHTDLVRAAAGLDGIVEFPVIPEPSKDYGAAYSRAGAYNQSVSVECLSLSKIYQRFGHREVDLLHVDIQGAEADLISHPEFSDCLKRTRIVLFGTHMSDDLHEEVADRITNAGFELKVNWPRNSSIRTMHGELRTNDGALLAVRHGEATDLDFDFSEICQQTSLA